MGRCFVVVTMLGLLLHGGAWGQQKGAVVSSTLAPPGPFSLSVLGNYYVPVADSAHYFGFGAGEEVRLDYQIPGTVMVARGGMSGAFALGQFATPTIFFASAELGLGARFPIASFLSVLLSASGGYWYGSFYDMSVSSSNPYAGAGVELQLSLNPILALSLGAQFKDYFGLWQGMTVGLGMKICFESR